VADEFGQDEAPKGAHGGGEVGHVSVLLKEAIDFLAIRRGGTYGPALPEGAPEDGVERGVAAFVGCASLTRQFEFAMNVWVNDPKFKDLDNERDPIVGNQDGTFDMTIPRRPIRKRLRGLPAFTTIRGGAYFFLPGIKALRFLAGGQI